MDKQSHYLILTIVMILAGVIACRPKASETPDETAIPQGTELPFETIDRSISISGSLWWEQRAPRLVIVADKEDLTQFERFITVPNSLPQLGEVDFESHFFVAMFLGRQPTTHEGITLEKALRQRDVVSLSVQVGGSTGKDTVTSPYHLVKVKKEGDWRRRIDFMLYLDGVLTILLPHFIP